jgi:hypothetical protein
MKKILLLSFFITSLVLSQESNESILSLKNRVYQSSIQQPASSFQNPLLNIQLQEIRTRKSPGLAILYSLLLPGMGELYADNYSSGIYFTVADGICWGVFAGFNIYGNWQEKNYRSFAESNAGANLDGKESDFFANMGSFLSVDEYNKTQELNREFGKVYDRIKYFWEWSNHDQRKEYREMWSSSESAFTNLRFAAGALVLNRLISAINAVRSVSNYNKSLEEKITWNIYFSVNNQPALPKSLHLNFISEF